MIQTPVHAILMLASMF